MRYLKQIAWFVVWVCNYQSFYSPSLSLGELGQGHNVDMAGIRFFPGVRGDKRGHSMKAYKLEMDLEGNRVKGCWSARTSNNSA